MQDAVLVDWLRRQAAGAQLVFTVCTGAILLGATGLLRGRRATTHWASHHLLPLVGAIPVDARVVEDGPFVTAAGVTSGFDGALRVAARLRGEEVAQGIQLYMQYDPEPPFSAGSPARAPTGVVRTRATPSPPWSRGVRRRCARSRQVSGADAAGGLPRGGRRRAPSRGSAPPLARPRRPEPA